MAEVFEFEAGEKFHFASAFAKRFGVPAVNNTVPLPDTLGSGYIREVYLEEGLSLCIHQYELKDTFIFKRLPSSPQDILSIKFNGGKNAALISSQSCDLASDTGSCAVEISTSNLFVELTIQPGQPVNFLVMNITRKKLLDLLRLDKEKCSVESTFLISPSFVLHEGMTLDMERILEQIFMINGTTKLANLLFQTKSMELLYLLLVKLMTRSVGNSIPVNQADVEKMYELRTILLTDLSAAPELSKLSQQIGISLTKMKLLFRQIFGDSIYNYYQSARMNEAARLLSQYSVSETGYKIGFSNLSHFTRLFEKHHQIKPKRYKDTLAG